MADSTQVPGKYDVVIDGEGYIFWNALDPSLPFRTHRATYSYSPTFLPRSNITGKYGDDSQAFWMTATQTDWSEGEGRRYFRSNDADIVRRFWTGTNIDVTSVPGQVSLRPAKTTLTVGESVVAMSDGGADLYPQKLYAAGATHLYSLALDGSSSTDLGAHGLGCAPALFGMTGDSLFTYLSSTAAGTVGVRKINSAHTFSTFSATGADALSYMDNTLFGFQNSTGQLVSYDTAGTPSVVFVWQAANGATGTYQARLKPYGGKLMILRQTGYHHSSELWMYDGNAVSQVAEFPPNFTAYEMEIVSGVVFVSGTIGNDSGQKRPAIYYYVNGQIAKLWAASSTLATTCHPAMVAFDEGLAFTDDTSGRIMLYNIAFGGVQPVAQYTASATAGMLLAANQDILAHSRTGTTLTVFNPSTAAAAASGTVVTSLFDFDSSLLKLPRGIKIEYDPATDGDHGSVDIAYQFDSVDGSYTTLRTAAASGTEYVLPAVDAHSVSVKVTLNKGSSTKGPVLKRIFVRAVPLLTTYRLGEYVFDLSGRNDVQNPNPVRLRDGTDHPLSGAQMLVNLQGAMTSDVPIAITDRVSSFNGVLLLDSSEIYEMRPGEFVVKVTAREV